MSLQKRSANSFVLGLAALTTSLTAPLAWGETSTDTPSALGATSGPAAAAPAVAATVAAPASGSSIYGMVDIRPSVGMTGNDAWMENAIEAGYSFSPNVRLTYLTAFDTNIADKNKQGLGLKMWDGFFRMRVKNILQSDDKTLSFSYQGRLYTPTDPDEQAKGHVTTLRSYFTVTKKVSSALTLSFSEDPILHAYSKAGNGNNANKALFENQMILDANIQIAGPVSLYIPVVFHVATYQNYQAGAAKNNSTSSLVYIYPELGVAINDNISVGLSYYSGNLVKADLSATALGNGLENGVTQAFITANL